VVLNLKASESPDSYLPRIAVLGIGGAGGNAVRNMIEAGLAGVSFVVANTDAQALEQSPCETRIQLGRNTTGGLGAGSRPEVGREAAEEMLEEVLDALEDFHLVFLAAGMGGGTGTGAAPVIARAAREAGLLTVGVMTKPFDFEGPRRMRIAEAGLQDLQRHLDTLLVIPNQNLFQVVDRKTSLVEAFALADGVLQDGVRALTDLILRPGLINLDFSDVRVVIEDMGRALMGTGEAEGELRAVEAATAAIGNPLLEGLPIEQIRALLVNITGGGDLTLHEVEQVIAHVSDQIHPSAHLIFGSTLDPALEGRIRVAVVATASQADAFEAGRPTARSAPLSLVSIREQAEAALAQMARDQEEAEAPGAATDSAPESKPESVPESQPAAAAPGDAPAAEAPAPPAKSPVADLPVGEAPAATAPETRPETRPVAQAAEPAPAAATEAPADEPAQLPLAPPAAQFETSQLAAEQLAAEQVAAAPAASEDTAAADDEDDADPGFIGRFVISLTTPVEDVFQKAEQLYHKPPGERDLEAAFRAYFKAAKRGHAGAQNRLGWMYERGEGVETDYAAAAHWHRRAAEQGHLNGMNDLGYLYRQGRGVSRDFEQALYWFHQAAKRNYSYAEFNIGQMYEKGYGVQRDLGTAVAWYRKAALRNHEWAEKRLTDLGVAP
jgi:cell division protein FtsZ